MAFADAFSTENMNKLMQDPKLMLGLALMAQGRQGSSAQALGQAGLPAVQMINQQQNQQQLQQYRQAQIQQAEEQRAFQMQQAQAKAAQQQRQQAAFQDPALQAQLGPMAKALSAAGIDPSLILKANSGDALQAHRAAQLAQDQSQFDTRQAHVGAGGGGQPPGPKAPMPRQVLEEPLPDGRVQKHLYDAASGQYKPYGSAYFPYSQGKPKATGIEATVDQLTPDDNVGAGPAVPGLPGSNASSTPPPSGAELLMHGAGSNPHARKPANSTVAGILAGVTPPDGQAVVDGILAGVTPKYGTPPKASAPPAASQPQYPGAPAVGTVVKGFKFLGGNPADPKSWSKS
jgi:hypothetical protein